jgi:hypothetical protein
MNAGRAVAFVALGLLFVACANGGDLSGDIGEGDDAGGAVDGPSTQPIDSGSHDSGRDTGGAQSESSTGVDSAQGDDGAGGPDGSTGDDGQTSGFDGGTTSTDSGSSTDSGTTSPDTGGPDTGTPDTGSTSGGQCGSNAKYTLEAAAEVASGNITFCFGGTCSAGFCCYEQLNPGNICVTQ